MGAISDVFALSNAWAHLVPIAAVYRHRKLNPGQWAGGMPGGGTKRSNGWSVSMKLSKWRSALFPRKQGGTQGALSLPLRIAVSDAAVRSSQQQLLLPMSVSLLLQQLPLLLFLFLLLLLLLRSLQPSD